MVVRFRDGRRDGRSVYTVAVLQWEGGDLDGERVKRAFIHWSLGIGGRAFVNGSWRHADLRRSMVFRDCLPAIPIMTPEDENI